MPKAVFTKHQPSITEWFASIGKMDESDEFRAEDNLKYKRLEFLYQTINLLYERPQPFEARDLTDMSEEFKKVLEEKGDDFCAIRLVPKKDNLKKIRLRGWTLKKCYHEWYLKQDINPDDYIAEVCPHSEKLLWSTIFVIKKDLIFGETIRGLHSQLTHGDTVNQLIQFQYDFKNWQWSEQDCEAKKYITQIISALKILDLKNQEKIKAELNVEFTHDYMMGYFETTVWPDKKFRFTDFNRVLPKYIPTPKPIPVIDQEYDLKGVSAFTGKIKGKAVIVTPDDINKVEFNEGDILVCNNTDVRYLSLMKKAGAIITNRGGILSHAAIISRELKKPCIINTIEATEKLKTNNQIEVNADLGIIKIL